jgi:pimeloyl-ACP methyl ester carboxylesterase
MNKFLDVAGFRIAYREVGHGPCVLCLHGWPTNSQLWEHQMRALKNTHRVVAMDWPGFGASDKPEQREYTFSSMASVLDQVIQHLISPAETITLVGHDIGGPPAILWAAEQPERIEHLILLNTVLYTLHTPLDRMSEFFFKVPGLRSLLASPTGLKIIIRTNTRSGRRGLQPLIEEIVSPWRRVSTNFILRMISSPMKSGRKKELLNISTALRSLPVNKHLIVAPKDPLCGQHMQRFHAEAPEVDIHFIPNCGHYMPIDQPERISEALRLILGV